MLQQRHQPRRRALEVVEDSQPAPSASPLRSSFASAASRFLFLPAPYLSVALPASSLLPPSSPSPPPSPSLAISPSDFHPPTASSNGIPCTHRLNVSPFSPSDPPLSFVIHPRSPPPTRPSRPHRPVADPHDPFQACLILATVYYARTNRAAHVGPPRESNLATLSARAPPSQTGSRSGVCTSRCSPAISRAQFSPGDRPVRTGDPGPPQYSNPGSFVAMTRRLATRRARASRQEVLVVLAILPARAHPLPRPVPPSLPVRLAAAGSF